MAAHTTKVAIESQMCKKSDRKLNDLEMRPPALSLLEPEEFRTTFNKKFDSHVVKVDCLMAMVKRGWKFLALSASAYQIGDETDAALASRFTQTPQRKYFGSMNVARK